MTPPLFAHDRLDSRSDAAPQHEPPQKPRRLLLFLHTLTMSAPWALTVATVTCASTAFASAMEAVRFYQEVACLSQRNEAYLNGYLAAYDALWTSSPLQIPSTEYVLHLLRRTPWLMRIQRSHAPASYRHHASLATRNLLVATRARARRDSSHHPHRRQDRSLCSAFQRRRVCLVCRSPAILLRPQHPWVFRVLPAQSAAAGRECHRMDQIRCGYV